jgi:proteasome lid subunit RPN8/RPN11
LRCAVAVVLSRQAFGQLFSYAHLADGEMSCLGVVTRQAPGLFLVEKFYLVEQSSSSAHTEMEPEAVGKLVENLLAEGRAEEARSLKCWAHSHPGMKCFWSGTDEKTCRHLATGYVISLVVAEGLELLCRLDVGGDLPFTVDGVPVYVDYDFPSEKEMEAYAQEVQAKVKPAARNLEGFLGGLTPISLEDIGGEHGVHTYPCGEEEASACAPRPYVEYWEDDWLAW